MSTHYLQFGELADVRGELHQVIVPHVEGPQALPQIGKVSVEGRTGKVVIRQVQDLQRWEGAKASGQLTQSVDTACTGSGGTRILRLEIFITIVLVCVCI